MIWKPLKFRSTFPRVHMEYIEPRSTDTDLRKPSHSIKLCSRSSLHAHISGKVPSFIRYRESFKSYYLKGKWRKLKVYISRFNIKLSWNLWGLQDHCELDTWAVPTVSGIYCGQSLALTLLANGKATVNPHLCTLPTTPIRLHEAVTQAILS